MAFEHYMGSKKEVAATRMALLKEKRIAEPEENPRSPGGASFVESVEEARSEKLSLAEALEQRRRRREAQRATTGGRNATGRPRTTPDVEFHSGLFHSARASGAAPRALD